MGCINFSDSTLKSGRDQSCPASPSAAAHTAVLRPYTSETSNIPSLIDPRFEHESCGAGFVATLDNQPSHDILEKALTALARLEHRGAIAADGKSSDGIGIMTAIPRDFLLAATGI